MKLFRLRTIAKTVSTSKKILPNKARFLILTSIVLIAISSTAVFSSTSAADSIAEFIYDAISSRTAQKSSESNNDDKAKKDVKSSKLFKLAPDAAVAETATARQSHTATQLADGSVLIVGGDAAGTAEIVDGATGNSSAAGALSAARSNHTATKLSDGRILITGGTSGGVAVATTEIYDAANKKFIAGATMNQARSGHAATVLADGKILFTGGDEIGSAEIYDAAAKTFTPISTMTTSRSDHSAILMKDGRVFIAGGKDAGGAELNSVEIYDPANSTFSATGNEMAHHRSGAVLRVLHDGKVQIIGGNSDTSMEVYDPAIDTIGAHAHVIPTNDEHDALLQSDILSAPTRAAMFNNGQTDALLDRSNFTVTELGDKALVFGGVDSNGNTLNSSTLLNSSNATVTTDKLDYQPGQTAVISGTGWKASEKVDIIIHEDPHTHTERRLTATANPDGNFTGNYLVEQHDLNVTFIIGAKGQISGRTAQTTFTDNITNNSVSVTSPTGSSPLNVTSLPITVNVGVSYSINGTAGATSSGTAQIQTSSTPITTIASGTNSSLPGGTTGAKSGTIPVTIPAGISNGTYKIVASVTNNSDTGVKTENGAIVINVPAPTKLAFITPSFTAVAGQCGSPAGLPVTVQLQNAAGNKAQSTTNTTVSLTSSSTGGTFYSDAQCTRAITSVVISNTGNSAGFYYKDTTTGTPMITAVTGGLTSATQIETIVAMPSACSSSGFSTATNYNVGSTPAREAIGDFNMDGKLDLVVANGTSNNVSVLMGNGTGGFSSAVNFNAGTYTSSVAISDFNSDGKPDLAVVNSSSHNVSILLGDGLGSFSAAVNFNTGLFSPRSIAIGDFNSDGKSDLAVTNGSSNNVSILFGNGTGNFPTATNFALSSSPQGIALGDFNSDGKLDLVTTHLTTNNISVLLGDGGGSFSSITNFSTGTYPISIAIGDFNADGKPDLVTSNYVSNDVSVLLGIGAGSFSTATNFNTGSGPTYVALGDINNDGKLDLVTSNISGSVSVLSGDNTGNFLSTNFNTGLDPRFIGVADFNGDGKLDLTVANPNFGNVSVFLNTCTSAPDLTITKSHSGNFTVGTNGIYTLTVKNAANAATTSSAITVTDTLPTGLSFVSGTGSGWTCSASGQTVSCTNPNPLAAGATSSEITLSVGVGGATPIGTNSIINTASVSTTGETNTTNNSASDPTGVNQGSQMITFNPNPLPDKTYGDADFTVSATASSGLPVSFAASGNCNLPLANVVHITGAGSCTITASQAGDGNYSAAPDVSRQFTINQKTLTPNITVADKIYDGTAAATIATRGFGLGEVFGTDAVTLTGETATFDTKDAGNGKTVTATGLSLSGAAAGNYVLASTSATTTANITKATLTATAEDKLREYGDANPSFTVLFSNFAGTETLATSGITGSPNCTTTAMATSPASPPVYPISCTTGTLVSTNYNFNFVAGNLTVTKANLTVSAGNHSREYGDANPTFTPQYGNFKNNETAAALTTAPTCTSAATAASPVSPPDYSIVCSGGAAANYNFSYVNGALTVTKATLTVTANDKSREYGDANPAFDGILSGVKNGENITATYASSANAASAVGVYSIVPTLVDPDGKLNNYAATVTNGKLTVTTATATITANDKSRAYGAANPAFDAAITGLKNNETSAVLSAQPICSTIATATSPASPPAYTITCSGAAAGNYSFNYVAGSLTITKAILTVTAENKSRGYGAANPAFAYSIAGYVNNEDAASAQISGTPSLTTTATNTSAVGNYPITAEIGTLTAPNYNFQMANGVLEITAAVLTVSADNLSKNYGDANPALSYSISGYANNENAASAGITGTPVLSTTATDNSAVGGYPIKVDSLGTLAAANYSFAASSANGTLTVSARAITVAAEAKSKTYGDGDPALTYQITSGTLAANDTVNGSLTRDAGENVGTYAIKQGTIALNANYALTFVPGVFTINAKAITVTADAKSKIYGESDPALTYQITSGALISSDNFSGSLTRETGNGAGTYQIKQGTLALSGNYTLTYIPADLTITKRGLTITASSPNDIVFGSPIPAITAIYDGFISGDSAQTGLSSAPVCSTNYGANSPVGAYTTSCASAVSVNYEITYKEGGFKVYKASQAITFNQPNNQFIGVGGIIASATGGASGNAVTFASTTTTVCTTGGTNGATISFVNLGVCSITASQNGSGNYENAASVSRSFSVNPDTTAVTLDLSGHSLMVYDCVKNAIAATVRNTVTNQPVSGATVTLSIGAQNVSATTDSNGRASGTINLTQTVGQTSAAAVYAGGGSLAGNSTNQTATISPNTNVGPGRDATSLYTGSLWFWTTSATSSTATLTLSATVVNTGECNGDITKAKTSFLISTNGSTFSPVSGAQNLPVGLVNPNDPNTGTASAISQYNIGNSQSVTLTVRVVVGGQYTYNESSYDIPITIGKAGTTNSLMGGGKVSNLANDGNPFKANGFLGANSVSSMFGSQVSYNKNGTNPQGQVQVYIDSYNKPDGSVDTVLHRYFIKSNSISELSQISGSASFGSKTNVSEVLANGTKVGLDGGGTMQIIFTPYGKEIPRDMFTTGTSFVSITGTKATCTNQQGCMSITAYKSTGGVWYSSSWGQGAGTTAPHTYVKPVLPGGNIVIQ